MFNYLLIQVWSEHSGDKETMYYEFWCEVVRRTARMVADWQCVGWCHGYATFLPNLLHVHTAL